MCSVYACFAHPADNSRVLDGHAWASRWHGDVANGGMATVPGHGGGYGWSTQITDFLVLGVGETEATFKAQAPLAQMSDCSEPQTLTAGSVGVVAKCDGSSAFVKLLCSGGLEECFICKHNFQYVSRHQLSDTAYAMYRFYASRKGLGFRV